MNYDMKRSGERIRQLRKENKYTQERLAQILNIDQSYYGRIERGKKGCSVDLFIQLSVLFGVSLDYLILGRYPTGMSEKADIMRLKSDINDLVNRLEVLKQSL